MRNTRMDIRARLLIILLVFSFTTIAMPTVANAAACYGASCNGLDPTGRCDSDAKTVGAMDVTDGMLELRWSPSCAANWGRYTPYWRTVAAYRGANPPHGIGIWALVTVWNPGSQSYGSAHNSDVNPFASSWSQMTDGRGTACTGVEVIHTYGNGDNQSQGWTWGPCY
jgi:hypothetical protein